jgi:hypothetical protein
VIILAPTLPGTLPFTEGNAAKPVAITSLGTVPADIPDASAGGSTAGRSSSED